jgi:hypothetical protein
MLNLLGSCVQMTTPSPLKRGGRKYEAYLRAPAVIPLRRYGTVDAYRLGGQHLGRIAAFPEPDDAFAGDFGIQESGQVTVQIIDQDNLLP